MERTTALIGMAIGLCTFGLAWAVARHFTGLAQEHGAALGIAVVVGVLAGLGYIAVESSLFDILRRRSRTRSVGPDGSSRTPDRGKPT